MSIRFDASTDALTNATGLPGNGEQVTITCWVRIAVDRNDYSNLVSLQTAVPGRKIALAFGSDGATLRALDDALNGPTSGAPLSTSTWYAVAAVLNGTNCTLYWGIDSQNLSSNSTASFVTSGPGTNPVSDMIVGSNPFGFWLNGSLANLKIYEASLTNTEIAQELGQFEPVRVANLLHWYAFKTVDLNDASGNGNVLTAGSTSVTADTDPPIPDSAAAVIRVPVQTIQIP